MLAYVNRLFLLFYTSESGSTDPNETGSDRIVYSYLEHVGALLAGRLQGLRHAGVPGGPVVHHDTVIAHR